MNNFNNQVHICREYAEKGGKVQRYQIEMSDPCRAAQKILSKKS